MLISYRKPMGIATKSRVIISAVGVMIAANIQIITKACFLYFLKIRELIKLSLPIKYAKMGISNIIPKRNESIKKVEMYELNSILLTTNS